MKALLSYPVKRRKLISETFDAVDDIVDEWGFASITTGSLMGKIPDECLHSLTSPGLPPAKLELKASISVHSYKKVISYQSLLSQ